MTRKRNIKPTQVLAAGLMALGLLIWTSPDAKAASAPHSAKGCAMCHSPHNAASTVVPLWTGLDEDGDGVADHTVTTLTEATYDSSTMDALEAGNEVSGASVLCLSCHDGVRAASRHTFGESAVGGMGSLATSHPIGIVYDAALVTADAHGGDPELVDPATLETGVLDGENKVGCPSCHDVHASQDTTNGFDGFLRWGYLDNYDRNAGTGDTRSDDFCNNCHIK